MSELNDRQRKYVEGIEVGLDPTQAAKRAGYKNPKHDVQRLKKDPEVIKALEAVHATHRAELKMTREKVQDIVTEAIEMARLMSDPLAMIRGAQELNKMCGFYAPEVKEVHLNGKQRRLKTELENMSEQELLALVDATVIEGEFTTEGTDDGDEEE
jgi:phage terminase small subunit